MHGPLRWRATVNLLWQVTQRELRVRYKSAVLGCGWLLLTPLALTAVFTVVFSVVAPVGVPGYPLFFLTGFLPWSFVSLSVAVATTAILEYRTLVRHHPFARIVLPTARVLANFLGFLAGQGIICAILLASGIPLTPWVVVLPVAWAALGLLAVGLAWLTCALHTRFRDVKHLVELGLLVWFYGTPIVYPLAAVPARWRPLCELNPMTGVVTWFRTVLLEGRPPDLGLMLQVWGWAVGVALCGWVVFRRVEPRLADWV